MASIVLSSIGSSLGNMVLPGVGGRLMGSLARRAGNWIDGEIGWRETREVQDGARLENFKVQDSRYGLPIPVVFGRARVAGNVIWCSELIETAHDERTSGGKGGVTNAMFGQTRTTYTYSVHCAIALCAGEIGSIQTIWADSKVIYQNGIWKAGVVGSATVHTGAEGQGVDPLLESWIGAGEVPAYQGMAYVVLESLQLGNFGNRLPNLTFEILPKALTGRPVWEGQADPQIYHTVLANRYAGMPPLTIDGGAVSARRMIVGGHNGNGLNGCFRVVEYDVRGEAPAELARAQSQSFVCEDIGDHSWALASDGRFVAAGLQDGAAGCPYHIAIYDTQARVFGPVLSVPMEAMEVRQLAWIDAHRFVVTAQQGGRRGVRLFMRAGLSVLDLGFCDVWGVGTATTRVPVCYAQFIPYADGLLQIMGDAAVKFGTLYARHLSVVNNELVVGEAFQLAGGHDFGNGSGPQVFLRATGPDEWTVMYLTAIDMHMTSVRVSACGAQTVRAWQKIVDPSLYVATGKAPVVCGDRIAVVGHSNAEPYYRVSEVVLREADFALAAEAALVEGIDQTCVNFGAVGIDGARLLVTGNGGYDGALTQLGVVRRRNTGDTMDRVVGAVLLRAGYEPADFDVGALGDVKVDGYVLSEQATAASAIRPLQLLEPFDLIESAGQLKALRRDAGERIALDADDVVCDESGGAAFMTEERVHELDLPRTVEVDFVDAARDYEIGSQFARRDLTGGARDRLRVQIPIVCTPARAKAAADALLQRFWTERVRYRLSLPVARIGIDPGDVLEVDGQCLRVLRTRKADGLLRVDGVAHRDLTRAEAALADGGGAEGAAALDVIATSLFLMDLPLLRGEDDRPGLYVAASGLPGWPGAGLWRSEDGENFSPLAPLSHASVAGVAVTALPAACPHFVDRANAVQVQLLQGELSGCSRVSVLNGANAALLGGEVIQFETASLIGPGLYELRGLLRGRKGTEDGIGSHRIGESFVLLSAGSLTFLPLLLTDRSKPYHYRAVSIGQSLDYAQDLIGVSQLRTLAPLAPVHLRGRRGVGAGGDVVLSWVRRARVNAEWVDYIDVPLDEALALYDVEIVRDGVVVRCFSDVAETSLTYDAAMQTADFGGVAPAQILVNVYQKSARYGRGHKATALV